MPTKTIVQWEENYTFDVELNGHHFKLDADPEYSHTDNGPRPKGLLLSALAGCTGMDVVSILNKMQFKDFKFRMDVTADSTDGHPSVYEKAILCYYIDGDDLDSEKIEKAVNLSQEKYCGVSAMLKKAFPIEIRIFVNGNLLKR